MEKKHMDDWYIAGTYFLIGGFLIPELLGFILGFVMIPFLGIDATGNGITPSPNLSLTIFYGFTGAIFTLLGVLAGANYIKKTYTIAHPHHVAMLATVYFVGFAVVSDTLWIYFAGQPKPLPPILTEINSAEWLIDIAIFYFFSKKKLSK